MDYDRSTSDRNNNMPDDSAHYHERIDQLTDRIDRLEAVASQQQETIEELREDSLLGDWGRRGVLGTIAAGLGLSAASGSAAAGVGDVGTASSRVDVFGDLVDTNTLEANDLDIGGTNLLSDGDFAAIGPSANPRKIGNFSTTSQSYVADSSQFELTAIWDSWVPASATGSILFTYRVSGDPRDIRFRDRFQSETVYEELDVLAGVGNQDGFDIVAHTPSSTDKHTRILAQIRSRTGNQVRLRWPSANCGVEL